MSAFVHPKVIDLDADTDAVIRTKIQEGLGGISPMFAVKNHGLGDLIRRARESTRQKNCLDRYDGTDSCVSCELTDELGLELKSRCRQLVWRLCAAMFGDKFREALEVKGRTLDGRQSMRWYPEPTSQARCDAPQPALGAHVDNTFFTMLWADGPGLQVPSPMANLTAADVSQIGLPMMGPCTGAVITEEDWVDVGTFWEEGLLLVTVGQEWIDLGRDLDFDMLREVQCPVLHRVRMTEASRHSFPFLVRSVTQAESDANTW